MFLQIGLFLWCPSTKSPILLGPVLEALDFRKSRFGQLITSGFPYSVDPEVVGCCWLSVHSLQDDTDSKCRVRLCNLRGDPWGPSGGGGGYQIEP